MCFFRFVLRTYKTFRFLMQKIAVPYGGWPFKILMALNFFTYIQKCLRDVEKAVKQCIILNIFSFFWYRVFFFLNLCLYEFMNCKCFFLNTCNNYYYPCSCRSNEEDYWKMCLGRDIRTPYLWTRQDTIFLIYMLSFSSE